MSLISKDTITKINFNVEDYEELFSDYVQDLQEYIKAFSGKVINPYMDYAKRLFLSKLEEKWLPLLNFNGARILSDIRDLQAPKIEIKTSLTMRELLSEDDGKSDWLIPNLLSTSGLYILAAPPKTGKTVLLNFLIYGVAVSGEFLGRPVQTGNVMYVQLEESTKTMKKRAVMSGFGQQDEEVSLVVNFSDRVRIERSFDLSSDLDWLSKQITKHNINLVVIDSLRMASVKSEAGENTNEFGKLLYALQRVINFTGTCCVLVHHMNKITGKKVDLVNKLSGHTSISAASDGIIGLSAEEDGDGKMIVLKTKPRDGTELTIYYRLVRNDRGMWEIVKIYEDNASGSIFTSKILRYVGLHTDEYFTARALAAAINADSTSKDFLEALEYLDSSEIISRKYQNKSVLYGLKQDALWIVNPQRVKDMVSGSVLDANALMLCKTKQDLRKLVQDWEPDRSKEAKVLLFTEEKQRIKQLIDTYEFSVGQEVSYQGKKHTVLSIENEDAPSSLFGNKYFITDVEDSVLESELFELENVADKDVEVTEATEEKDTELVEEQEDLLSEL